MGDSCKERFDVIVKHIKDKTPTKHIATDEIKLQFYALYKQATIGDCNTDQPWAIDITNRAKWEAWNKLTGESKDKMMNDYCDLYQSLNQ